jgi:hypothetical protein
MQLYTDQCIGAIIYGARTIFIISSKGRLIAEKIPYAEFSILLIFDSEHMPLCTLTYSDANNKARVALIVSVSV